MKATSAENIHTTITIQEKESPSIQSIHERANYTNSATTNINNQRCVFVQMPTHLVESHPVCSSNSTHDSTTEGRPLLFVCRVVFVGPFAPTMEWSKSRLDTKTTDNGTWIEDKTVISRYF